MAILKLKEAGEEATLAIVSAEVVQGQYGEQVKFDAANGDTLYVPSSSVARQLDRCGVAEVEELAGRIIHFSRAASNKPGAAPYWNLDKARKEDVVKTNGKPVVAPALLPNETGIEEYLEQQETGATPAEVVTGFDALVAKYEECMDAVTELLNKRKAKVDPQAYAAMVATLYISRNQARV